ncbi:hypothetical protein AQUCO_01300267v1 [Aquilegia coerulea]|uniref:Uncharacterized protein n=1 Tax=Aquilegia coerulea TaxID=218851 RepID=A0A2G5E0K2_AQUCA|nr:hypothetical protein AQUCO_01300267v1 [Aquilegia coerulea]
MMQLEEMKEEEIEIICEEEMKKKKRKINEEADLVTRKKIGLKDGWWGGVPFKSNKRMIPTYFESDSKSKNLENINIPGNHKFFCGCVYKVMNHQLTLATFIRNLPRNIPPHDSTACTPEKAYPVDQIVFRGHRGIQGMRSLLGILHRVNSGAEISPDAYPSFVCNRVHKLLEIKDKEERKKLACIFSYITFLIAFKDQQLLDSTSTKTKKDRIPYNIFARLLTMFADDDKYNPSVQKRDLLISYVLVLALIVDGYHTNISDIARDLKMTTLSLKEYYLNLGCKVKLEDESVICTLSVPLEFP